MLATGCKRYFFLCNINVYINVKVKSELNLCQVILQCFNSLSIAISYALLFCCLLLLNHGTYKLRQVYISAFSLIFQLFP